MQKSFSVLLVFLFMVSCAPKLVQQEKKEEKPQATSGSLQAYVLPETVNLRQQPHTKSKVVQQMTSGETVFVLKNINGWYAVQTEDGQKGYIRSDLVGPRSLSRTTLASAFVDSLLPNFGAEMFFDKKDLYKTVYLTLKPEYYQSKNKAKSMARKIGLAYQQNVYPGAVELRVLKQDSKELYTKIKLKSIGMATFSLPVFKFGRLARVDSHGWETALYLAVPDSIPDQALLKAGRNISGHFGYPVSKVEVFFISDSPQGLALIRKLPDKSNTAKNLCRLYYLEDKDGEDYKFNFCPSQTL